MMKMMYGDVQERSRWQLDVDDDKVDEDVDDDEVNDGIQA